jgi:hypothetical protein
MTTDPLSPTAVAAAAGGRAAAKFLSPASPPAIPSAALASAPAVRRSAASWAAEEQRQRQEAAATAAADEAQQREQAASSFGRALRTLSSRLTPTNYNMVGRLACSRGVCDTAACSFAEGAGAWSSPSAPLLSPAPPQQIALPGASLPFQQALQHLAKPSPLPCPSPPPQLLFRTLNRDLYLPNANDDYIAPLFR